MRNLILAAFAALTLTAGIVPMAQASTAGAPPSTSSNGLQGGGG